MVYIKQTFIVNEISNDFILKNTFQYFYFVTTYLKSESDGRYVHILELHSNIHNINNLLLNPKIKYFTIILIKITVIHFIHNFILHLDLIYFL